MNDFQKNSHLKVIRYSKDLNERLLDFAKNQDLPYRLKNIEEVLIQNGTRIQLPIQYGYYKTISDALNIENPLDFYNDTTNFVEILSADFLIYIEELKEASLEETKVNTDFLSEFEKLVNSDVLEKNISTTLKKYSRRHIPSNNIFIDKFYDNSHLKYVKKRLNSDF